MDQLLHIALAFPTVLLTILVGVALVYWIFVILGALDIDLVADADADGLDGGGETGGDGASAGPGGDGVDGAEGGHGDHGEGSHSTAGILSALGLRDVPLTISVSLIVIFAWMISMLAMLAIGDTEIMPPWLLGALVLVGSVVGALPLAAICARPIAPLFVIHQAKKRKDYVGSVCTITTGEVTARFGQARIQEGGYVLDIPVRCESGHGFARHDKALIIDYDRGREVYVVEPLASVLGENKEPEP